MNFFTLITFKFNQMSPQKGQEKSGKETVQTDRGGVSNMKNSKSKIYFKSCF